MDHEKVGHWKSKQRCNDKGNFATIKRLNLDAPERYS